MIPPISFISSAVTTFILGVEVPVWAVVAPGNVPVAVSSTFATDWVSVQTPALLGSDAAIFIVP